MSVETVKRYLKQWDMDSKVMEFNTSSATVELAAKAVGVIPARIAKTLSFLVQEKCFLVVVAGDARVKGGKFKTCFGTKASMLTPDQVIALTGHAIGGVCPFAIDNPDVEIYLDISLKRFVTVFPACGSSNSAIEMTCEQLCECSGAKSWVDVCKDWDVSLL